MADVCMAVTQVAQQVFGFPQLRGHQGAIIDAVLRGRSTLAIMPTGTHPAPPALQTPECDDAGVRPAKEEEQQATHMLKCSSNDMKGHNVHVTSAAKVASILLCSTQRL